MKLLLALLAMLTGFSVVDGVRVAEPAFAQGEGSGWNATTQAEDNENVVHVAAYLVAVLLPLAAASALFHSWYVGAAPRLCALTVCRSDRMLQ